MNPDGEDTVGFFISDEIYREYENPRFMIVDCDFAYVSNFGSSTISKIHLECPEGKQTVKIWADEHQGIFKPTSLAIQGSYLYVTNSNNTISRIVLDQYRKH